jgi:hypothetical protein
MHILCTHSEECVDAAGFNWSTRGNNNPFTGQPGTVTPHQGHFNQFGGITLKSAALWTVRDLVDGLLAQTVIFLDHGPRALR